MNIYFYGAFQCNYQQKNLQSWIKSIKYITAKHKTGRKEYFLFNLKHPSRRLAREDNVFFSATSDRNNLKSQSHLENI